jgi:hypothetical protein
MPLQKGHSKEIIAKNIHEMVKAGHKPKEAIAASLASARKYKKMSEGGLVDNDMDDDHRNEYDLNKVGQQMDVENPEAQSEHQSLAMALMKHDDDLQDSSYAYGGIAEGDHYAKPGNKHDESIPESTDEPMTDEPRKPSLEDATLPEHVVAALKAKKLKRRF